MHIPEETIKQIIEANDIVEVITRYVPDLKRAGSAFKACCPFHNEKSPSFNVNPHNQYYKCFGCGEGGDVLKFVQKMENLHFTDSVKKLAGWANIPLRMQEETKEQARARKSKTRIIELHNDFAKFLHELLLNDPRAQHARDYLDSRGFGSDMIKNWVVGYHPETPQQVIEWAKAKGYKARELVEAGLANTSDNPQRGLYYRFRDRLMFPIANDFGDFIAFSGRQLKEDPNSGKYINSPETNIFKKSKVFFGLDKARRQIPKIGFALLVEGQMDVIACHERGFDFAVATQGTAFTPEQAVILKRYTKNALICYDSDSAGQKATEKAFVELAKAGINVKVVLMPEGEDPDSLMLKEGEEALAQCIEGALDFFDYKVRYESKQRDLNSAGEKAQFASDMSELLASMTDNFQLHAALGFLSTRLGLSEDELRNASRRKKQFSRTSRSAEVERDNTDSGEGIAVHTSIAALCHISLNFVEAYDWLTEQIEPVISATEHLSGAVVLQALLTDQPRPDSPSQIQAFIAAQPSRIRNTLNPLYSHVNPQRPVAKVAEPLKECQQLFRSLSLKYLERTRKGLAIQTGHAGLSSAEVSSLQNKIAFISDSKLQFQKNQNS